MAKKRRSDQSADQSDGGIPEDLQELIQQGKVERKEKADEFRRQWELHRASMDARRFVQACAEYARPGQASGMRGPDESEALFLERLGQPIEGGWQRVNEEFCRGWLDLWMQSREPLLKVMPADQVARVEPGSPVAAVAKKLYVDLLRSDTPSERIEELLPVVRAARVQLGPSRFDLHTWFARLRNEVPQHQSPRSIERQKRERVPPASRTTSSASALGPADKRPPDRFVLFIGAHPRVELESETHDLTGEQARILAKLAEAEGAYVPGDNLRKFPGSGEDPGRTIKRMREPIEKLIKGKRGQHGGYKLLFIPEVRKEGPSDE